MEEKTKTEQGETGSLAVSANNISSKKNEMGNAEQTAKMLKDEIKSLDGGQRAAIIFEANLKPEEAKRILKVHLHHQHWLGNEESRHFDLRSSR
jgi:hypothetical protein